MKRWLGIIIPLAILATLIGWRLNQKNIENAAQAEQKSARMNSPAVASTAVAQVRDIISTFEATGSVEAPMNVKIAPKITGRIEMLQVREGDRVRKGQVLVRIDDSDVEAQVQQAMANLAEAQYRLAQAQLNQTPTDVAVNTQIRQQKAGVSSAEADYQQVKESYKGQLAEAEANVSDADSKIENAKAAVNSALANLNNAKSRYNRIHNLYKQGFIAAQDVDDAQAAVTVQESAYDIAQGQLNSTNAQKDAAQQRLNVVKSQGKADIEAARAKAVQARASLDYAKANTSSKTAYRQSIAALKASVEAARAGLKSAEAKRQDTVLKSPLDGFVTGRYADPGAITSPTQPIIAVQFINQVWVTIAVPEEVCAKLHIGQPASIRFDAYPGKNFTASIVQINPSADPQSRQFSVRVILSNSGNMLKPGMFAHVSLETDRVKNALVVPREAVQRGPEGASITLVGTDSSAKRTPVVVGSQDDKFVQILDGLKREDKVVTMSAMPVKDGQKVISGKGKWGRGGRNGGRRK